MKLYYYLNSKGEKMPPVDFDQLRGAGITPDTYVWFDGLSDWKRAGEIPELQSIIKRNTPPMPPAATESPASAQARMRESFAYKPSSYMWLGILTTLLCCLPFGIVSIVYASKVDGYWAGGMQDEADDASRKAKNWGIAAAVCGFVVVLVYVIFCVVVVNEASHEIGHELNRYDYYE